MAFPLFKKIVYNCKRATLLIVKKEEQQLTTIEKVQLSIHLHFCNPCKRFVKQSELIDYTLKHSEEILLDPPVYSLPEETRIKIQQELTKIN